ncbi:reprolysin-like metallopeptidase [Thalassotalea maritima]|uniref:reprolysin-like metallopeptidase n=1 Tax=Thalassotalea maritima TaxID=3242416 RepID=UPI00352961EB
MQLALLLLFVVAAISSAIAAPKLWTLENTNSQRIISVDYAQPSVHSSIVNADSVSRQQTKHAYSLEFNQTLLHKLHLGDSVSIELPQQRLITGHVTSIIDDDHSRHISVALRTNGSMLITITLTNNNHSPSHELTSSANIHNTPASSHSAFATILYNHRYYELLVSDEQSILTETTIKNTDNDTAVADTTEHYPAYGTPRYHAQSNKPFASIIGSPLNTDNYNDSDIANIDILVLYDEPTQRYYQNLLPLKLDSLQTATNQIFANSDVHLQINFAYQQQVDFHFDGQLKNSLEALTYGSLQQQYSIEQLRYEVAADLVLLLLDPTTNNSAGYAWINGSNGNLIKDARSMYAVMHSDMSSYILAHELGHTLGLRHSRRQAPFIGATYDYAVGYGVEDDFVTVMAYLSDFQATRRILQFSNPRQQCFNLPCGIDAQYSQTSADANLALNQVRWQAAEMHSLPVNLTLTPDNFSLKDNTALQDCLAAQYPTYPHYLGMLTQLDCAYADVNSLKGIDTLFNLQRLTITDSQLHDITALQNLNKLKLLNLSHNQIDDISVLFHRPQPIFYLSVANNPVYCWQQQYLQQFANIEQLVMSNSCSQSQDNNDYDYDGVSNIEELNQNSDPTLNEQGNGSVAFRNQATDVLETSQTHEISLYRPGGNIGELNATIQLASDDSTDTRLKLMSEQLTFKHGQVSATIELEVSDDNKVNGDDVYTLRIVSENQQTSLELTVIDDDVEPTTLVQRNQSSGSGAAYYLLWLTMAAIIVRRLTRIISKIS